MRVVSLLKKSSLVRTTYFKSSAYATKWIDRMLNIDTISLPVEIIHRDARFDYSNWHEGFSYLIMKKYIHILKPSSNNVIFDIGRGMGRILYFFARRRVKKMYRN